MKIAFLLPFLKVYGAIRTMVDLSNEMVSRGHFVTVFSGNGASCDWLEVKAEVKPKTSIFTEEFDCVVANLRGVVDLLNSCKAQQKVYLVSDRWGSQDPTYIFMLKSNWLKLAPTKVCQDWLETKGVRSTYFPIGVNREIFYPVEKKQSKTLKLLCSGDRRPEKGFDFIIKTMGILKDQGVDFELRSYYGKGLSQSEMASVYSSADIFVEASSGDAALRNNPVLESLACGTPVVVLDHDSVKEWVIPDETAISVPYLDPNLFATAIADLYNNKPKMIQLRSNALIKVSNFTWKRTGDIFEEVLKRIM